jgi:preprotein translocase subunit SecG
MGILTTVISVMFIILCVLLVILILLQSDKSAGMGILGGSSQSAFGSSTADVITKATGIMIGLFMLGSVGLATLESNRVESLKKELTRTGEKKAGVKTGAKDEGKTDAAKPAEPAKADKGAPVK